MTEIITPIKRMTLVSACTKGQLPEDVTATYADIAFAYTDEQIEELYDRLYNKPVAVTQTQTCSEADSENNALANKILNEFKAGHMTEDKSTFAVQLIPDAQHYYRPDDYNSEYYAAGEDFNDIDGVLDCVYRNKALFFNLPELKEPKERVFELPTGVKGSKMLLGALNRFLEMCGLPPRSSVNVTVPMSDYAPLSVDVNLPVCRLYTDATNGGLKIHGVNIGYSVSTKSKKQIAKNKLLKQSLQDRKLTLVMPKTCVNAAEVVRHGAKTNLDCPVNLEFVSITIIGMPGNSLIIPMLTMNILESECHGGVLKHDGNLIYTHTGKPLEDELRRVHQQHGLPFKSLEDYADNARHFSWWAEEFKPGILPGEEGKLVFVNNHDQHCRRPYPEATQVRTLYDLMKLLSSGQGTLNNVDLRTHRKVTFALTYAEYLAVAPIVKAVHLEYFNGKGSPTVTRIDAMDAIRNFYTEHKEDIDAVERLMEQNTKMCPVQYAVPGLDEIYAKEKESEDEVR